MIVYACTYEKNVKVQAYFFTVKMNFDKGFSTGHGFLRTPNDIQSYAALACIARSEEHTSELQSH